MPSHLRAVLLIADMPKIGVEGMDVVVMIRMEEALDAVWFVVN